MDKDTGFGSCICGPQLVRIKDKHRVWAVGNGLKWFSFGMGSSVFYTDFGFGKPFFEHVCILIFFSGCTTMSQLGNVSSFTNKVPAPRATFYRTTTGSCNLSASAKTTITYTSTENVTRWTQKVKWTFDTPLHRNYACLLLKISVSFLLFLL